MKRAVYLAGRALQAVALLAMPSAMWVAHFDRDERLSLGIFLGSFGTFAAGYGLTRLSGRI